MALDFGAAQNRGSSAESIVNIVSVGLRGHAVIVNIVSSDNTVTCANMSIEGTS